MESYDPFKADVFSLAIVILRVLGLNINEIKYISWEHK